MKGIHQQILKQIRSGSNLVLATVIRTTGSTPQKPGSSALFGEEGLLVGTVGGGMLEGEIQHVANSVLISGLSDTFYFNLDTKQGDEGSICGGDAMVLVDANPAAHLEAFEAMERSLSEREEGSLLTILSQKQSNGIVIQRYWIAQKEDHLQLPSLDMELTTSLTSQYSGVFRTGFLEIELSSPELPSQEIAYLEQVRPMPHLIIAGAGHIGKALAHLGSLLDFEVTVIDDRPEYANSQHIPEATHLIVKDIGVAMEEVEKGPDTFIVLVTRGHQYDAEALKPCLGSQAAYVGMIGSRHKVGVMKKQFLKEGWATPEQWSHIHDPIGISIGSQTVQ